MSMVVSTGAWGHMGHVGIWTCWKGGQMCGGARCVYGWGLSHGASLRHIVGGPTCLQHVEKGQGASMMVSTCAWGHAGRVGDLGMSDSDAASYNLSQLKPELSWVPIQAEPWLAKPILPASTST